MYKHILIPTDGSEVAQKGVDHGLALAQTLGARVTIITVTEPFPYHASAGAAGWVPMPVDLAGYAEAQKAWADQVLKAAGEAAARQGVNHTLVHVPEAQPAESIISAARNGDCSLIVISSHGRRGLGRLLLGSQTMEVLSHSPVPVLVVR